VQSSAKTKDKPKNEISLDRFFDRQRINPIK